MGYTPNYSHLVGIMISKTIGFFGVHYFQTNPILRTKFFFLDSSETSRPSRPSRLNAELKRPSRREGTLIGRLEVQEASP